MTGQSMVFKVTRCYALQYNHRRRVDSTPYWPPSTGTVPITVPGLASRASGGAIAGSNCLFVPSHGPSPPESQSPYWLHHQHIKTEGFTLNIFMKMPRLCRHLVPLCWCLFIQIVHTASSALRCHFPPIRPSAQHHIPLKYVFSPTHPINTVSCITSHMTVILEITRTHQMLRLQSGHCFPFIPRLSISNINHHSIYLLGC